jgi:hypothetical protein
MDFPARGNLADIEEGTSSMTRPASLYYPNDNATGMVLKTRIRGEA